MKDGRSRFADLSSVEEALLTARLRAIRSSIDHAGEKGRALEFEVRSILRGFLPAEYGLSTGFVVYESDDGVRLSSQLDIVIYDAIRGGPIVSLETCDVFPLEAVYAYVEVKASITSTPNATTPAGNSIEACLKQNKELRSMTSRKYWSPISGMPVSTALLPMTWLPIRGYVFAFENGGPKSAGELSCRMADCSRNLGPPTHLHGVFIAEHAFFYTRPVDPKMAGPGDYYHVGYTEIHPLLAFKTQLLRSLVTFPKPQNQWAPGVERYFEVDHSWEFSAPTM